MKKEKRPVKNKNTSKTKLFYISIFVFIFYILFFNLRNSAFFQNRDRLNIVTSEEKIFYYSLGLFDNVNYFIPFYADLEVIVPGGYGHYRLGALPKLASLEKEPDLIKKTYSLATSSVVDFYFYPGVASNQMQVYFGEQPGNFSTPNLSLIFFGVSNANFFDRLYIYLNLFGKAEGQFRIIENLNTVLQGNRKAFASGDFFEATQGIFYRRTYRSEQRNVQILYTKSYKTAREIGQILEGEGIRVSDLSQTGDNKKQTCQVVEEGKRFSQTAKAVGQFFGCQLTVGNTGAYDIILKLGEKESEWEIE